MIFDKGLVFDPAVKDYIQYSGVASMSSNGYSSFLHGCVVDMLYFPIFETTLPKWFPFWGGEEFEFFSPIFNIADASISVGVITLLLFQKRFFKKKKHEETFATIETSADISDKVQVQ
jgi:signal peptidase II